MRFPAGGLRQASYLSIRALWGQVVDGRIYHLADNSFQTSYRGDVYGSHSPSRAFIRHQGTNVGRRQRREEARAGLVLVIHLRLSLFGVGNIHRAQLGWRALRALAPRALKGLAGWLAGCPLAGCSAKCYYTGVTSALCSKNGLQHSLEIKVENMEAVYNDFHSGGFINGCNCLGYSWITCSVVKLFMRSHANRMQHQQDETQLSWSNDYLIDWWMLRQ